MLDAIRFRIIQYAGFTYSTLCEHADFVRCQLLQAYTMCNAQNNWHVTMQNRTEQNRKGHVMLIRAEQIGAEQFTFLIKIEQNNSKFYDLVPFFSLLLKKITLLCIFMEKFFLFDRCIYIFLKTLRRECYSHLSNRLSCKLFLYSLPKDLIVCWCFS